MGEIPELEQIRQAVRTHLKRRRNKVINLSELAYRLLPQQVDTYHAAKAIAADLTEEGYEIQMQGQFAETIYFVKRPKNQLLHDAKVGVITGAISLLVGWLLLRADNRETVQQNRQQDEHLIHLDSVVNNLNKQLADSVSAIRHDTTFLRKR